jgi:mannose-6-phosphate isomerase-like protein (cupin superfamily)
MIIETDSCFALSTLSARDYWDDDVHPKWAKLSAVTYCPGQHMGHGVEPHYHDNDEFWFFTAGYGEAWMDGECSPVTPNTIVYTPRGVVHRFQMFTEFATVGIRTRMTGQRRAAHLRVPEDGIPTPSAPGLVVPGEENTGPIAVQHPTCPVRELRLLTSEAAEDVQWTTSSTEYILAVHDTALVRVNGLGFELASTQRNYHTNGPGGDLLIIRQGSRVELRTNPGTHVLLGRE